MSDKTRIRVVRSDTFEGSVWLEGDVVEIDADLARRLIDAGIAAPAE